MEDSDFDGPKSHDFEEAWGHPHAFALIKAGLHNAFMMRDDFSPENPYDELIKRVTATGMIRSAYELNKNIEVRYGWELLDDDNLIMHSCFGIVDKIDIRIGADSLGFLMDVGDGDYCAFAYKEIFWVCEANSDQFK